MPTKSKNIDLSRQSIREFFSDFIDRLGITFPNEDARQKTINATSDSFKVILSENVTTKDFVEARVIQSTAGLATNENLAKLEDKLDKFATKEYLHSEMNRATSTMIKWFVGIVLSLVAILLAVLVPLILTLRH